MTDVASSKKFINLHQHTHFSNVITIKECINTPQDYVNYATEHGLSTVCFTEHGNVLSWCAKKKLAEEAGLKFIHGIEAYVTDSLENKIRDNYHLILLAKNYEGVKEINRLSSKSFKGRGSGDSEEHNFYYVPRISKQDVFQTSDNIIILTGCLGGPLWQYYLSNQTERFQEWKTFITKHSHRVYLEIQAHHTPEQISYNKLLKDIHDECGVPIVATNDVHVLNESDEQVRKLFMKSNTMKFEDSSEDKLELWCKSYDEMVASFREQGVFTDEQIEEALANTLKISDSIESFELDYSFKYPQIFENPTRRFQDLIQSGYTDRHLDELPVSEQNVYRKRIRKEYQVYQSMNSIDYMLLMQYIIGEANQNGIHQGYARGSVSGSLIAYLIGITEVDPIKENLSFERFMNKDRVSLSDIDTDFYSNDRDWVTNFMIHNDKFNCSSIVTYNSLGIKQAIKDIGRAMGYDPQEMNTLTKSIVDDIIPAHYESQYPELIENAKKIIGVVTSIGRHAGGYIVTTDDISEEMGLVEVSNSNYPVSAIAMKEVDKRNYVKLDMLGLDNIGVINQTCDLAGIPRATPNSDYIDFHDKKVMEDLRSSAVGIFQFEGQRAQKLLKDMFSESAQKNIAKSGVNTDPVNQLALLSAAMRPGAASIIDDIVKGKVHDNGHPALNELLQDTLSYLIYQESQIEFLVKFCGRTPSQADLIRRAIGKKDLVVLEQELPKIKQEFIDTMVSKYNDTPEHAEEIGEAFLTIFQDAANYSFSRNHAIPYSYIGYISAWLRYYYPLEFLTTCFNVFHDDTKGKLGQLIDYAKSRNITVKTPKYGYSKGKYFFNRDNFSIYEGTAPIKGNNEQTGDLLYEIATSMERPKTFVEFLLHIRDTNEVVIDEETFNLHDILLRTPEELKEIDKKIKAGDVILQERNLIYDSQLSTINKTKILGLIHIGYFDVYGPSRKLKEIYLRFMKDYKPNNKTLKGKGDKYKALLEFEKSYDDTKGEYSIHEKALYELKYLGRMQSTSLVSSSETLIIEEIVSSSNTKHLLRLYQISTGERMMMKVKAKYASQFKMAAGDLIKAKTYWKNKVMKVGDSWVETNERELWIQEMAIISPASSVKIDE